MNRQQQQRQKRPSRSTTNNRSDLSGLPLKIILLGVGVIAVLFVVQSVLGSISNLLTNGSKLNLKKVELNPTVASQRKAQVEAPRYGLDDKTVSKEQVGIVLRDNGAEDGDYVTLFVDGRAYTQSSLITHAGRLVPVNLKPGAKKSADSG